MIEKGIFIIGVRKCGTTNIYHNLLNQDCFAKVRFKEPQYFCLDDDIVAKNLSWYCNIYSDKSIILDGSSLYFQYPGSYSNIVKYVQEPHYVLCLRDPAKRFYSAYCHMFSTAEKAERRSLEYIVNSLTEGTNLTERLSIENYELSKAISQKEIDSKYLDKFYHRRMFSAPFDSIGIDPLSFYRYYKESLYSMQIQEYDKLNNNRIIFFEEYTENPVWFINEILTDIDIRVKGDVELSSLRNSTRKYKYGLSAFKIAYNWLGLRKYSRIDGVIDSIKEVVTTATPKLKEKDYLLLRDLFTEEYDYWLKRRPSLIKHWKY